MDYRVSLRRLLFPLFDPLTVELFAFTCSPWSSFKSSSAALNIHAWMRLRGGSVKENSFVNCHMKEEKQTLYLRFNKSDGRQRLPWHEQLRRDLFDMSRHTFTLHAASEFIRRFEYVRFKVLNKYQRDIFFPVVFLWCPIYPEVTFSKVFIHFLARTRQRLLTREPYGVFFVLVFFCSFEGLKGVWRLLVKSQ